MGINFVIPRLTNRRKTELVDQRSAIPLAYGNWSQGVPLTRSGSSDRLPFGPSEALNGYQASEVAYRCVDLIASELAQLDLVIVENGEIIEDNPIADLFNKASQDAENAVALKRVMWSRLEQKGECFIYMDRGESGEEDPSDFAIIYDNVTVKKREHFVDEQGIQRSMTTREKIAPKVEGYEISTPWGIVTLLPSEVLWLRYPHFSLPWQPMAPGDAARMAAGLDQEARKWQASEFYNQARPSGIYNAGPLSEERAAVLKAKLESEAVGPRNAGRVLVLYGNTGKTGFDRIGLTPAEMSYIESHGVNGRDICVSYGVPVDLIFGQSTFDNQDAAWKRAWSSWKGKLEIVQSEIDRQLFPDFGFSAQFDLRKVEALQESIDGLYDRAIKASEGGIIIIDEARKMIGFDPFEDERGKLTVIELKEFAKIEFAAETGTTAPVVDTNPTTDTTTKIAQIATDQPKLNRSNEDSTNKGVIVAFWIDLEQANEIAIEGYEAPDQLHLTLAYLGKSDDKLDEDVLKSTIQELAFNTHPIDAEIAGKGIFNTPNDGDAIVGLVDSADLCDFRSNLVEALETAGIKVDRTHGFTPHVTFAYVPTGEGEEMQIPIGTKFSWSKVMLAYGDQRSEFELSGASQNKGSIKDIETRQDVLESDRVLKLYDRHERIFKRAIIRIAEKQRKVVIRELNKATAKRLKAVEKRAEQPDQPTIDDLFKVAVWTAVTVEILDTPMDGLYVDAALLLADLLGVVLTDSDTEEIISHMRSRLERISTEITNTTHQRIKSELEKEQTAELPSLIDRIKSHFSDLETWRASNIAETEVLVGANSGFYLVAAQHEDLIAGKEWVPILDDRTRHSHAELIKDGIKPLKEKFSNGLLRPGDPDGPPEEVCNCRCHLRIILKEAKSE